MDFHLRSYCVTLTMTWTESGRREKDKWFWQNAETHAEAATLAKERAAKLYPGADKIEVVRVEKVS